MTRLTSMTICVRLEEKQYPCDMIDRRSIVVIICDWLFYFTRISFFDNDDDDNDDDDDSTWQDPYNVLPARACDWSTPFLLTRTFSFTDAKAPLIFVCRKTGEGIKRQEGRRTSWWEGGNGKPSMMMMIMTSTTMTLTISTKRTKENSIMKEIKGWQRWWRQWRW